MTGTSAQFGNSCNRLVNAAASSSAISLATTTRSGGPPAQVRNAAIGSANASTAGASPSDDASRVRIFKLVALLSTTTTRCEANRRTLCGPQKTQLYKG